MFSHQSLYNVVGDVILRLLLLPEAVKQVNVIQILLLLSPAKKKTFRYEPQ